MASLVEKYEQILAADPRSRIFVELARALVDRGDHARAVEICRQGLEHHPGSILGRVIWGRALLAAGDLRGGRDQFDVAIGIDPGNPYAYNLVGEALTKQGLFKEALPVLARALELQPADARVKGWLDEARRRAGGGTSVALPAQPDPAAGPAPAPAAPRAAAPAAARPATRIAIPAAVEPEPAPAPPAPVLPADPAAEATVAPDLPAQAADDAQAPPSPEADEPVAEVSDAAEDEPIDLALTPAPVSLTASQDADRTEEMTLLLGMEGEQAGEGGDEESIELGALQAEDEPVAPPMLQRVPVDRSAPTPAIGAVAVPAAPPPRPPTPPAGVPAQPAQPARHVPGPRTLLSMIPPTGRTATGLPAQAEPAPDPAEAARVAAAYERELREAARAQEAAQAARPPSRRRRALAAAALVLVAVGAVAAYVTVKQRAGAEATAVAIEAARAGLARDTKASLGKAAEVLATARELSPRDAEVRSLSAQVAALLAADHGDEEAGSLARTLADDPAAGDGAVAAKLLLASQPGERSAAAAAVLAARPGSAPLLQRLAGRLLLEQGQVESARGRLDLAARATPPLLGALADLGDSHLVAGDAEAALPFYEAALSAHPTHPRSAIGAAEARLALGRPLDASRAELLAVENDPGSAPPRADRLRFELAFARVLAASGDALAASRRLTLAAGALGDSGAIQAARASLLLGARLWEPAAEAAGKALRLAPSAEHRILLARARLGQRQPAAALETLAGVDTREAWLERGIAQHQLGQYERSHAALERTMRDGRMPAEAATWYALGDVALGRADRAVPLLEKLAAAPGAAAATHAALGRALLAAGQGEAGEAACRRAIDRDARTPEGHLCLGAARLAAGKPEEAVGPLETALSLDRADPLAQRLLAQAKAPPRAPAAKATPRAAAKPAAAGTARQKPGAAPAGPKKAPSVSTRR